MDKDVIILVRGTQSGENEDTNRLDLITEGKYYKKGGAYYITYNESEVTGMNGTTTTLKIADGIVTLTRSGSVNSMFVFERGHKHVSYYDTSYGAFTVGVFTNEVNIDVDDDGGEIRVGYELDIDNNIAGANDFHLYIREAGHFNDKLDFGYKARD